MPCRDAIVVQPRVTTYVDRAGVTVVSGSTVKQYVAPVASTTHVFAHNLGRLPIVEVQTLGGLPIVADYVATETTVMVYLLTPLRVIITVA